MLDIRITSLRGEVALKNAQRGRIVTLGHGCQLRTPRCGLDSNVFSKTTVGCKGRELKKIIYLEIKPADKVSFVIEIVDRKIRSFRSFWHDLWSCDTFELLIILQLNDVHSDTPS